MPHRQDGRSTLSVAADAANQFASKHFDVRAHYLREQARDGALELVRVSMRAAQGMPDRLLPPLGLGGLDLAPLLLDDAAGLLPRPAQLLLMLLRLALKLLALGLKGGG